MLYDVWIVDNDSLTLSSSDLSSSAAELVLLMISLDSMTVCYPLVAPSLMRETEKSLSSSFASSLSSFAVTST